MIARVRLRPMSLTQFRRRLTKIHKQIFILRFRTTILLSVARIANFEHRIKSRQIVTQSSRNGAADNTKKIEEREKRVKQISRQIN